VEAQLSFYGAAENVTGSRYLLESDGIRVLVDCGLYQEREYRDRNWEKFPVEPAGVDAVVLTHAHVDHCGYIPRLVKGGFGGGVYCTPATSDIAQIALLDSAHLQEEDARLKRLRHEREGRTGPHPVVPLYTQEDAVSSFRLFRPRPYGRAVNVAQGVEAVLHEAGHILGSSMVTVDLGKGKGSRRILFSGDVGRWDKPILNDPTTFERADYVVVESTYGNRHHEDPGDVDSVLEETVKSALERGGNVIVPSFAIGRTQEVLYRLNTLLLAGRIPHVQVYIDSPMAIRVTEVFERHGELFDREMMDLVEKGHSPFSFPGLKMTSTTEESKELNYVRKGAVIIAGSGMCTGGRIKHHLVSNLVRPESTILFVGYQAVGTLGREIVDGARKVRIHGEYYPVRARIRTVYGFSAHPDREELMRWLSALGRAPRRVFVTHGEPEAARSFARLIEDRLSWEVSVPRYMDTARLG
jgi:metallo-beta-lactamase family protein